jgi:hypothetical protein
MKILPVGAELLHGDRQTDGWMDMTRLKVAVRNFAKAPKIMKIFQQKEIVAEGRLGRLSELVEVTSKTLKFVCSRKQPRNIKTQKHKCRISRYKLFDFTKMQFTTRICSES